MDHVTPPRWYDERENLARLLQELVSNCLIDLDNTPYFLEKPWKWQREWEHLLKHKSLSEYEE